MRSSHGSKKRLQSVVSSTQATISIVIPVYNEGDNIIIGLRRIAESVESPFEVLIVYDFDEDSTLPAARKIADELDLSLRLVKNRYGRGALNAIKTGLHAAACDYVIVTMADLSDPPEVINDMVAIAQARRVDLVCASRYMPGGKQIGGPLLKTLLSRLAGVSLYYLTTIPTRDATNSFKLYTKRVIDAIDVESTGGFELGLEIVVKAHYAGFAIAEVPTVWTDRTSGQSRFQLFKWLPNYLRWYVFALAQTWPIKRLVDWA